MLNAATLEVLWHVETGQGPIWAVALGDEVFSGGNDGAIRRFALDVAPLGDGGGPPDPTLVSPRGAEVFRACAVCHALTPDDGARAGPTRHGIFGRPIASAPGYDYSQALQNLDIIWARETVSELFEFGPDAFTLGSRMPEQRVRSAADRQALISPFEVAAR